MFRDLHRLFDEHGKEILGTIDLLGERLRILGSSPVSGLPKIQETTTLSQPQGQMTMHNMLQEASANHERVIQELHNAIRDGDAQGDPGTSNLLTDILQMHQKQAWFLREALQRGDGLVS